MDAAPPSSPSACSTLSLPALGRSTTAGAAATTAAPARRPPLAKRTTSTSTSTTASAAYVLPALLGLRSSDDSSAGPADIVMRAPEDAVAAAASSLGLSRSSSDLHLEELTIGGAFATPTKRKAGHAHAADATPSSLPSLTSSSSPAYDERLLTPRTHEYEGGFAPDADVVMKDVGAPVNGPELDLELDMQLGVKQNKHLDGYKALKAVLRCSSASTGEEGGAGGEEEGDGVVGRSAEKAFLRRYLAGGDAASAQPAAPAVYVSGPPGTGKTAVVTSLSRSLCKASTAHGAWKVALINCMGLSSVRAREDLWTRIADAWGIVVPKSSSAGRAVEAELRRADCEQSL